MLFPRRGEHLWIIAASVMFVAGSSAFAGGLTPIETLGKELFFDTNLSSPAGQSCASCHSPQTGYTGPNSNINANGAVMFGAVSTRSGDRKPPTVAYSAFSYSSTRIILAISAGSFGTAGSTPWRRRRNSRSSTLSK